MASNTAEITRRLSDSPCNCGCQGGDSWHKQSFDRVLSNVRDESGKRVVHAYGGYAVDYVRTATARLPWGEGKPVVVVEVVTKFDGGMISLGWFSTAEIVEVAS